MSDAVAAILLFALMMAFLLAFWSHNVTSAKNSLAKNRLEYSAISATDLMVKSQGLPTNWETGAALPSSLGLSSGQNVLSSSKLSKFVAITATNYSSVRSLLGTSKEFYFTVDTLAGQRLYECGNGSARSELQVSVERIVLVGNESAILRLTLYG